MERSERSVGEVQAFGDPFLEFRAQDAGVEQLRFTIAFELNELAMLPPRLPVAPVTTMGESLPK